MLSQSSLRMIASTTSLTQLCVNAELAGGCSGELRRGRDPGDGGQPPGPSVGDEVGDVADVLVPQIRVEHLRRPRCRRSRDSRACRAPPRSSAQSMPCVVSCSPTVGKSKHVECFPIRPCSRSFRIRLRADRVAAPAVEFVAVGQRPAQDVLGVLDRAARRAGDEVEVVRIRRPEHRRVEMVGDRVLVSPVPVVRDLGATELGVRPGIAVDADPEPVLLPPARSLIALIRACGRSPSIQSGHGVSGFSTPFITPTVAPSTPGKRPKRLSKLRFSIIR